MRWLWTAILLISASGCASTKAVVTINLQHQLDPFTVAKVEYRIEPYR